MERDAADPRSRTSRTVKSAQARYGFQASGTRATLTTTQADARGAWHGRARRIPASSGVRSRLARLQGRQAAATFSHTCSPPRERGRTWSIDSALRPQYWQR